MKPLSVLYSQAVASLSQAGIDSPEFDAMCMLEDCFSLTKAQYYMQRDSLPDLADAKRFLAMVSRRKDHVPLQYILGKWGFYETEFFVGEGVLIPRPETEKLLEMAVDEIRTKGHKICFDLCAGSGCIGLSIAKLCPETDVFLLEKYDEAIAYLEKNMNELSLPNARLIKYDVLKGFDEKVLPYPDFIVSNPPYIKTDELKELQKEVQLEPKTALDGGESGLVFYHNIAEFWIRKIPSALGIMLEAGEGQAGEIADILRKEGLVAKTEKDIYSVERFIIGAK